MYNSIGLHAKARTKLQSHRNSFVGRAVRWFFIVHLPQEGLEEVHLELQGNVSLGYTLITYLPVVSAQTQVRIGHIQAVSDTGHIRSRFCSFGA